MQHAKGIPAVSTAVVEVKSTEAGATASRRPRNGAVRKLSALCALTFLSGGAMAIEYTVAVTQSLTGPAAFIGAPMRDGALLAAEEINRNQELGAGNTLKVLVADDGTDRAQAVSLVTRYGADPKVLMLLGPTSGAAATAGANAANDVKLPILTTSNSHDVLKAGPWSFILTQPPEVTIPAIVNHAVEKLKVKNCTVIGIGDVETYVTLQKTFESGVKARGVRIGSVETIKGSDADFSTLATKVVNNDQDCVFISASGPQAGNIVIQLRQAGLDPKVHVLGHNSLSSPQFVQRGGKAVEGVQLMGDWVPRGSDDFSRAFVNAYKAKYNQDADNWAAWGYSGMRIIAAAIKEAGANPTRDGLRLALSKVKDVPVVVGYGRWTLDDKRVPHSGMKVLTVKESELVLVP